MNSNKKIIVGMSGGVDSSITAVLLKQSGYDVSGLFMKNWEEDDSDDACNSKRDYDDALRISKKLGIKLSMVNFSDKYWDLVFKRFINELNQGLTPNPDIYCNKEIKFNYFMNYALSLGCDKVATGHYAMIKGNEPDLTLNIPKDRSKDQTYFLYMLNQSIMKNLLFPLQDIDKNEVKNIAKDFDLSIYQKKESMGICFIGKKDFSSFIKKYINTKHGNICDEDGYVLGEHDGLFNYTIGQRKGIRVGGNKNYSEKPWFVINKDIDQNKLIISQDEDRLIALGKVELKNMSWVRSQPSENLKCKARFRHGGKLIPVNITKDNNKYYLDMLDGERAITPGQSAVLYNGDECIGGGIISSVC
ncbi:MAG: tRNA 2-thiouridine(34) synthase MnmA [Gammaproteobacteria bacterium]|nr:tRNA 2-thiouridine(34) synthase MnmA [Gammaproteobacteria bacterium]